MKGNKVIKILKNELCNTNELLQFDNMKPEYYGVLKEYRKAMKVAIKAVKKYKK